MSERIAWPRYLAICIVGVAMIFIGALAALPTTAAATLVAGGSMIAAFGWIMWIRALLRKHGPTRVLLWLVAVCIVLAALGLILQRVND